MGWRLRSDSESAGAKRAYTMEEVWMLGNDFAEHTVSSGDVFKSAPKLRWTAMALVISFYNSRASPFKSMTL